MAGSTFALAQAAGLASALSNGSLDDRHALSFASMIGPDLLVVLVVGIVAYAAQILLAYYEWKRLNNLGFLHLHWAFAFIPVLYYHVFYGGLGSSSQERNRVPAGFATIALAVASVVSTGAVMIEGIGLIVMQQPFYHEQYHIGP